VADVVEVRGSSVVAFQVEADILVQQQICQASFQADGKLVQVMSKIRLGRRRKIILKRKAK